MDAARGGEGGAGARGWEDRSVCSVVLPCCRLDDMLRFRVHAEMIHQSFVPLPVTQMAVRGEADLH